MENGKIRDFFLMKRYESLPAMKYCVAMHRCFYAYNVAATVQCVGNTKPNGVCPWGLISKEIIEF